MDLPVLDVGAFRAGERAGDAAHFVDGLRAACHGPGFFVITGHGIDRDTCASVLDVSRQFFALPDADKLAIENVRSPQFRGYTRVGHEHTNGRPDWREQLDFGAERRAREPAPGRTAVLAAAGAEPMAAGAAPSARGAAAVHGGDARARARSRSRLALSLGQPEHHFDPTFAVDATSHLKVIRYPGRAVDAGGRAQGVGAHKDYGYLAVLLQDDVGGLQVAGGGGFVDAEPVADAFVCNIGEMFEVATRGYYRATVHRVVSPPPGSERISVPFFFAPRLDARLSPVTLPAELAADVGAEPAADPDNPIFAEYGTNALKGWLRSHPEVARRHWSDLVPL